MVVLKEHTSQNNALPLYKVKRELDEEKIFYSSPRR
jgi:hypothetical protein